MAEVMTVKIDAEDVMERLMNECLIEGKSLRQWIKSIVDHKWIPCSEALPEEDDQVLATLKTGQIEICSYSEIFGWYTNRMTAVFTTDFVIAWMPFPEPYKAGDGSE